MEIKNHTECKLVPIEEIVENPKNPNTHSNHQLKLLGKIITYQGWRLPIVVSSRSGFIVRGHGRLMCARQMGLECVPVSYQEYDTEAQEHADLIADNRIAELAEIDRDQLKDIIEELDSGELDLDVTGFDNSSLEQLMSQFHQDEDNTDLSENLGEAYSVEIVCRNEQEQEKVYNLMNDKGYKCKILTL